MTSFNQTRFETVSECLKGILLEKIFKTIPVIYDNNGRYDADWMSDFLIIHWMFISLSKLFYLYKQRLSFQFVKFHLDNKKLFYILIKLFA